MAPDSVLADDCVPQISLTEQVVEVQPGGSLLGQYVMTTGDLCGMQIVALAVDNDDSLSAFSNLSGWNSLVVTDNFWDSGIVLSRDDFGSGSSYHVLTGPDGIGSFLVILRSVRGAREPVLALRPLWRACTSATRRP